MRHEVTIISDDIRVEAGHKLSLVGIYDRAILFPSLPTRILKLAVFQRWVDVSHLSKLELEIRGSALGEFSMKVEGKPTERPAKGEDVGLVRATLVFGPVDFLREGKIEFRTFFDGDLHPIHTHELDVKIDVHKQ